MLVKAQIFARMSPDEKNEVVERLQGLGYTVLMCGDGQWGGLGGNNYSTAQSTPLRARNVSGLAECE